MDHLFLNTIAFPVRRGVLFRGRKSLGDYCWELEVYCDESPQFADQEAPDDLLAGAAPLLSAQSLPLRVESPDELIGRVAFTGKRDGQYRVEIESGYVNSGVSYALRVQAWLEWQGSEPELGAAADAGKKRQRG